MSPSFALFSHFHGDLAPLISPLIQFFSGATLLLALGVLSLVVGYLRLRGQRGMLLAPGSVLRREDGPEETFPDQYPLIEWRDGTGVVHQTQSVARIAPGYLVGATLEVSYREGEPGSAEVARSTSKGASMLVLAVPFLVAGLLVLTVGIRVWIKSYGG